jgi:hydroxymethylglutaryl-CoA lyase
MSNLPRFVEFHEEGPREGFQIETCVYPLEDRARFVDALSESGLTWIEVCSFVSPKAVPSMADAEALFERIHKKPGVTYTGAYLNRQGFERLLATPGAHAYGKLVLYTTDAFALQNNNCTADQMKRNQTEWLETFDAHGLPLKEAYILTAFGCNLGGDVPVSTVTDLIRFVVELCSNQGRPLPHIILADTAGWANPEDVKRRIHAVRETAPGARVGLHLHDTRGLGGANF